MKIGIVSDTHDNLKKTEKAVEFFEDKGCEKVIHCGDIVAPFTAELFDADFEFHYVRGNNDGEWNLKETVEEFGNFYNNIAELEVEGEDSSEKESFSEQRSQENDAALSICVYHGTEEEIVEGLVRKDYDFVFRGHTHEKKISEHSGTVELNPGGIELPGQDEKFHVATLDTETREVEFHRIEA
ncbi:MAG: metallophosphoesterase [Candidatus Nanohalobium sp.]